MYNRSAIPNPNRHDIPRDIHLINTLFIIPRKIDYQFLTSTLMWSHFPFDIYIERKFITFIDSPST